MSKIYFKPGNMLYPLPAVMITSKRENERPNIFTVAWAGNVCTNTPMVSISIRKERYSYNIIKETKEFVINLVTRDLVKVCDYCGVKSGLNVDKFKETGLTPLDSKIVSCPSILESPVNIECKVREIKELGSHDMFIADVVSVTVDDKYMDETGRFNLNEADLVIYSHGEYFNLGEKLGTFGYSIKKLNNNHKVVK